MPATARWNDAQQAYFRAYSAEPDNPDILYNLAISLEHLRQNKLAAQYYAQADRRCAESSPAFAQPDSTGHRPPQRLKSRRSPDPHLTGACPHRQMRDNHAV
jgi:tetratricopeptide (TPR) repeat protein